MSPANWLREQAAGKNSKNLQLRNYSNANNKTYKVNHSDEVAVELLTELQSTLNENAKLRSENDSLKSELDDLRHQHLDLRKTIEANRIHFEEDLNKLQNEIKVNENSLIENSKKCLAQQKKYVEEIEQLKSKNDHLKLDIANKEKLFLEQTKNLESEKKLLELSNSTIKSQNEEFTQKAGKYKNKLKYAITIINDLNQMLISHTSKPDTNNVETQTEQENVEFDSSHHLRCRPCSTAKKTRSYLEKDDMLLSDIFFKPASFCDKELPLFNRDGVSVNLSCSGSEEIYSEH